MTDIDTSPNNVKLARDLLIIAGIVGLMFTLYPATPHNRTKAVSPLDAPKQTVVMSQPKEVINLSSVMVPKDAPDIDLFSVSELYPARENMLTRAAGMNTITPAAGE